MLDIKGGEYSVKVYLSDQFEYFDSNGSPFSLVQTVLK